MRELVMNTLIRDNELSLLDKSGQTPIAQVVDGEEFMSHLLTKLDVEIGAFKRAFDSLDDEQAVSRLADAIEVIYAVVGEIGISADSLDKLRQAQHMTHGGYDRHLLLKKLVYKD